MGKNRIHYLFVIFNLKFIISLVGYPTFKGQVLSGDDVWNIFQGLLDNNLANYSHLLTGMRMGGGGGGGII
jgi:hypothetical protein